MRSLKVGCIILVTTIIYCMAVDANRANAATDRLVVAAASSMTFAMQKIAYKFEKKNGIRVVISFGSTGKLSQQIESGAPFDIFFSADRRHLVRLQNKGLIEPDSLHIYAEGRLVLCKNNREASEIKTFSDISDNSFRNIAIANPGHAPYGIAAKEALTNTGLWQKLRERIVYGENIRQTLQYVQTDNAAAGIISMSISNVDGVSCIPVDSSLYKPIKHAVAIIKSSAHKGNASRFIEFAASPAGRAIMERYGFYVPRQP